MLVLASESDTAYVLEKTILIGSLGAELKDIKEIPVRLRLLPQKADTILGVKVEFSKVWQSVGDLEEAVTFMSNEYGSVMTLLNECKTRNAKYEPRIADLSSNVSMYPKQL